MATRHEITIIQFKADAGKANAAIDSIREEARKAAEKVTELRKKLEEGKKANLPTTEIDEMTESLRKAEKEFKQWDAAQKNLMRGVKALDEAIIQFNRGRGSVDSMSAALSKAARNAAQLQQTRVDKGSQTWHEMEALILALDKNLLKAKQDIDSLITSLNANESVSDSSLRNAASTLKELMDLSVRGSAEWLEYKQMLDVVQKATGDIALTERRLKGEIVDANSAREMAVKLTKEGAAAAAEQRKKADEVITAAKQEVETLKEKRLEQQATVKATQDLVIEQEKQIANQHDVIEGLEKEAKAEADAVAEKEKKAKQLHEEALAAQKAADQKEKALDDERHKTMELSGEVQNLKNQINALNAEPIKPKVDTSEIDKLAAKFKSTFKMTDEAFEKAFTGSIVDRERTIAIAGLQGKLKDKYFFDGRGESSKNHDEAVAVAKENVRRAIYEEISSGRRSLDDLELQARSQKQYLETLKDIKKGTGLKNDAEYQAQKFYNDELQRLLEIARQLGPEMQKFAQAQQQGAQTTNELTEAQNRYNDAMEKRKAAEQALQEIQNRGYKDDPRIKQLDEEIKKIEELIAVSEKYKKQFTRMSDKSFEEGFMGDEKAKNYVTYAQEYLKKAYSDKLSASVADMPEVADDPRYQEAAKRVAGGIVQNAQENIRRAIYREIQDGRLTSSAMEHEIETYRSLMGRAGREAGEGNLKDDPEYNTYKYIVAQMEKYLEVAKQVEAERAKIAGNEPFTELARQKDVLSDEPREGLFRQKEKRDYEYWTSSRDVDSRKQEDIRIATEKVTQAKDNERIAEEKLTEAKRKDKEATEANTQAMEASAETDKKKVEMQTELEQKEKALAEQQQKQAEAQRQADDAADKAADATDKAIMAEQQLGTASSDTAQKLADERKKEEDLNKTREQTVATMEQQQQAVDQTNQEIVEQSQKIQEAEQQKAQAQELSANSLNDAIAMLEKENKGLSENDEEWVKNEKLIAEYSKRLDEIKQKSAELRGEVMSLADAEEMAKKVNTDGFFATPQQLTQATQAIDRQRESLIKTIQQKQKDGKATKDEEEELERLTKVLKDLKFEQDNFNMSHKKMNDLLKEPKSAEDLEQLRAAIKRADGELLHMKQSLGEGNKEYKEFAAQVKNAKNELKLMENQAKANVSSFEKAWSRLKTYVTLYVGAAAALQRLTSMMGDLMELSDKLGEVRKTTGFTADEVGRLSNNLAKMDVRTNIVQLLDLSAAAGQLGLKSLEDVQGFTEAANKLMIALPEMGKEAATEMMRVAIATGEVDKIGRQMQEGLIEGSSKTAVAMEKIASTIDRLRASSASTAPEITDFVKRVGAVGAQSGITIDQVSALGSTISSLGLRIEMSATALSRMIPAIKNNAFDIAKIIGVTPETIRQLFDTGRGMEVILMVLQRMKDQGMDEDSIEQMMGMGGMAETMKSLNQQGARAGMVFAGLSQNVEELRRQLDVASDAYEENIAVQQEFEKMNETTAARWERLKNELEEAFVGDNAQRWLGDIIDGLRTMVNVISGNVEPELKSLNILVWMAIGYFSAWRLGIGNLVVGGFGLLVKGLNAVKVAIVALTTTKGLVGLKDSIHFLILETKAYIALKWQLVRAHGAEEKAAIKAKLANNALAKSMAAWKANVVMAIIAAIGMLVWKIHEWNEKAKEAAREAARFQAELDKETAKVDKLFLSVGKAAVKVNEANKEVEEARKTLKKAQEQTDESKKSTEELAKAEADLKEKEEILKNKQASHAKTIQDINSVYGQYLGFMLSEVSNAKELANAREMINDKLRETITLKRKEAALERVENAEGEDRDKKYADLYDSVTKNSYTKVGQGRLKRDSNLAAEMMRDITDMAQKDYKDPKQFRQAVLSMITGGQYKGNVGDVNKIADEALDYYNQLANIRKKNRAVEEQFDAEEATNRKRSQNNLVVQYNEAKKNYAKLEQDYNKAKGDAKKQAAANLLKEMDTINEMVESSERHFETDEDKGYTIKDNNGKVVGTEKGRYDDFMKGTAKNIARMKAQREQLLKEAGNLYQARKKVDGELTEDIKPTNPWGNKQPGESTDYKDMAADALVNRRKQMKDFVNAIQTDSDVQSVLKEDKALQKAIEKGMASDMRTVIEWYNTERLKIQDELHARHLTNTGDWMDPKKQKNAHKQFKAELDAYLEELDAYYTERKTEIETARNNEEITEGEAWRRNLKNENEWYQRRAELLKLYAEKGAEVTEKEQDAIVKIIAERTGDSEEFVRAMIKKTIGFAKQIEASGEKGAAMVHDWQAKIDLQTQKSLLKSQQAITKQVKFIEDTLAKERPYDGITKNMQDNLDKMGVLAAKMRSINDELTKEGKEPKYSNEDITAQSYKEMSFYLRQAEDAYRMDIDELLRRMAQEGMAATADEISKSDMLKQAVMGQLRKTYQEVHDAIKKEASQIKKDVELLWNDETLGPDGKSIKSNFDKVIAQLGMQQDSVSRANSLIGAGSASDNVASRIAMKQLQVQMDMQRAQFNMYRTQANQRIAMLKAEAKEHERIAEKMKQEGNEAEYEREILAKTTALRDADNVRRSLGLTLAEETKKEEELQAELLKQQEEIQARLYKDLREWADLLTSSVQSVMEASNAGNAEYYNELAKLNLTGKGGPGAGTYIVIENEGTEDAKAHYEYLDERQALERQREIEQQNAVADAWKKVMDDLNQKLSDTITDQLNAMLQNESIDANTAATLQNTDAIIGLANTIAGQTEADLSAAMASGLTQGTESKDIYGRPASGEDTSLAPEQAQEFVQGMGDNPMLFWQEQSDIATKKMLDNMNALKKGQQDAGKNMAASAQSTFAKMSLAANMYGAAYQAMTNDNLSTTQKFEMMALQAVGNYAINSLTAFMAETVARGAADEATVLGKLWSQLGWAAAPVFAIFTGLLGAAMGAATNAVSKSKSQIAQATGSSVGAGRLSTGMLTYASGNVNEFTDPSTLTPGRSYNVDAADGKTYRAKYTGRNPSTHLTNGPEFHLAGEAGREMIIDAGTTRQITMNDNEIWRAIQTLSAGGSMSRVRSMRKGRGVRAFADGNMDEFTDYTEIAEGTNGTGLGFDGEMMAAFQSSIDKNNELLERALTEGIHGKFDVYGPGGLVDSYDRGKKNVTRHGERY